MTTSSTTPPITARYRVNPYRFTERPREMITFLEAVGLRRTVERGDYAELRGTGGAIGVHPLATAESTDVGSTSLVLLTDDARSAADELAAAGMRTRWWDESFGRQAAVAGPFGEIGVNETMSDPYGYHVGDDAPAEVDVVAVYFTPDLDTAAAFFARFGFTGDETLDGWRPLRSGGDAGVIGLHAAEAAPDPGDRCALGFEIAEPLTGFAERMQGLGYEVTEELDGMAPHVTVTDPDGDRIEVHPR